MKFKEYVKESYSDDMEVLRASSIKKIKWLMKKMQTDTKIWHMGQQIITQVAKDNCGFVEIKSDLTKIFDKYLEIRSDKGTPEEIEARIGKDAYKMQRDRRGQELDNAIYETLVKNLTNIIFYIKRIKSIDTMKAVNSSVSFYIGLGKDW